jgi:hypothetical protein
MGIPFALTQLDRLAGHPWCDYLPQPLLAQVELAEVVGKLPQLYVVGSWHP